MTRSLKVTGGDLHVENGSFTLVQGSDKLKQDVEHFLKTEFGSDRFHPTYGSTLSEFIGEAQTGETELLLRSEVLRVLNNYQALQLRAYAENPQRFLQSEILGQVGEVTTLASYDTVKVRVFLTTLGGDTVVVQLEENT